MQSSSGMLMIDVGPTAASHLIVGGTATLNGTLKIVYGPGTYSPRTYPGIVSAGGGITDNTTKTSKGKPAGLTKQETERATRREGVGQYGKISMVAVSLKKK